MTTWHALKSKTAKWENRMTMNPDIAAHYQAKKDRKRLMSLARAWVKKKGGPPDMFWLSLTRLWPSGTKRLGRATCTHAYKLALGGF